jgi:Fe2+ transport system protein FeoA
LKKIKKLLDEEKNGNININEINPQNNINQRWKNLGIEKGDNISVVGDGINIKNEEN